jgi:tetratricopeptide (TPR) repeat protein
VALAFVAVQDYPCAEVAARRAILLASRSGDARREGSAYGVLGAALAEAGQIEPAVAAFHQATRRFRQLQDPPRLKRALFNSGIIVMRGGIAHLRKGAHADARRAWLRALRFYRSAREAGHSRQDDINIAAAQGECQMLLGRLAEGRELTTRAAAGSKPGDLPVVTGYLTYVRGEIARRQGRYAVAAKHLAKALKLLDRTQFDYGPADCRTALANLAEDRGELGEAAHWRAEAQRLADGRLAALAEFRRQVTPMWLRYLKRDRRDRPE